MKISLHDVTCHRNFHTFHTEIAFGKIKFVFSFHIDIGMKGRISHSCLNSQRVAGRQRGFKRFKTEWVFFSCDTDTPLKKNWANFLFQQLQFVCPKVLGWIPTRLDIISFQGFPFRLLGDFPRLHCVVEMGSTIWCNALQFWSFPFVTVLLISFLCGYKINCYHFLVGLFFCWHPV